MCAQTGEQTPFKHKHTHTNTKLYFFGDNPFIINCTLHPKNCGSADGRLLIREPHISRLKRPEKKDSFFYRSWFCEFLVEQVKRDGMETQQQQFKAAIMNFMITMYKKKYNVNTVWQFPGSLVMMI